MHDSHCVIVYSCYFHTGDFTKKYNAARKGQLPSNPNAPSTKLVEHSNVLKKFENKINLGPFESSTLSHSSVSSLEVLCRKTAAVKIRSKDKSDRATAEQVLDPRTRMILFKLLNRKYISEINGCVSTGKEANVYFASSPEGDCAIKVYKTSILVFKDRDKYVTGEFRFRHGYARHNPRKMVRLWAEKEMRNLSRLHQNGIPCPKPIVLRSHVLVMQFLGEDGWPYPKLKDVDLSESKAREAYLECVLIIRRLYHECKLIHADLSEYNILYCNESLYIIDVSQSVEHDHPQALEFLRKDCSNITAFFRKSGVCVMRVKELFEFVTDPTINKDNLDEYLQLAQEKAVASTITTAEEEVSEAVFQNVFIPRTLNEVVDFERDYNNVQEGMKQDIAYQTVTGLRPDLSGAQTIPQLLQESNEKSSTASVVSQESSNNIENEIVNEQAINSSVNEIQSETDSELSSDSSHDDDFSSTPTQPHHGDERQKTRKAHKQAVKEEKRDKRKHKIPKHVKKRKEKTTSNKRKK